MHDFSRAALDELERRENTGKAARREALRIRVSETDAPLPADMKEELFAVFEPDMRDLLRDHKGYRIAVKRDSYRASLAIFRRSCRALLALLEGFEAEALASGTKLFGPLGEERLREIELEVQKELFTFANTALSLVEHGRRAQREAGLPDYSEKRVECFGTDGLHEFVTSLRVLVYHARMVEAFWNLTTDRGGDRTAAFVFEKSALLQIMAETPKARSRACTAYIEAQTRLIDLKALVRDYVARADAFNDWLMAGLSSDEIVALFDYDAILATKAARNHKTMYSALLVNALRDGHHPPNPHDHLHRFLTPEQLVEVNSLPRNSPEQVERVIQFVDRPGVVDERLRELIQELFCRSDA